MKKLLLSLFILALASCSYMDALQEEQDIANGKLFTVEQGCVQYAEGIQFSFDQYGKRQRFDLFNQTIKIDSVKTVTLDISIVFKDSMFYLVSDSLKTYCEMQAEDVCDYMLVSVQEYLLWDGDYKLTKTKMKSLGDLEVDVLTNHTTKHRVVSYGRVRLSESNYEVGIFESTFAKELHNLNSLHYFHNISDVRNGDPFSLDGLKTFDMWKEKRDTWTQEDLVMYMTMQYLNEGIGSSL